MAEEELFYPEVPGLYRCVVSFSHLCLPFPTADLAEHPKILCNLPHSVTAVK